MSDNPDSVPAGAQAPESIADTSNNTNAQESVAPAPAPAPDMHGFTSEELAEMRTFFDNSGGFKAVKSRLSNPQQTQPKQPQNSSEADPTSETQPTETPSQNQQYQQYQKPPKGFASLQELSLRNYFQDLAKNPKYANIADQIESGDILREMDGLGMHPIDANYNINVEQLDRFLTLKAASIPTKPTSSEPTNTPIVEYINEGQVINDRNTALSILHQSFDLKQRGLAPHPDELKATNFLKGIKS